MTDVDGEVEAVGHSLRGLCGLKFQDAFGNVRCCLSQPARAVWIEI